MADKPQAYTRDRFPVYFSKDLEKGVEGEFNPRIYPGTSAADSPDAKKYGLDPNIVISEPLREDLTSAGAYRHLMDVMGHEVVHALSPGSSRITDDSLFNLDKFPPNERMPISLFGGYENRGEYVQDLMRRSGAAYLSKDHNKKNDMILELLKRHLYNPTTGEYTPPSNSIPWRKP